MQNNIIHDSQATITQIIESFLTYINKELISKPKSKFDNMGFTNDGILFSDFKSGNKCYRLFPDITIQGDEIKKNLSHYFKNNRSDFLYELNNLQKAKPETKLIQNESPITSLTKDYINSLPYVARDELINRFEENLQSFFGKPNKLDLSKSNVSIDKTPLEDSKGILTISINDNNSKLIIVSYNINNLLRIETIAGLLKPILQENGLNAFTAIERPKTALWRLGIE